MRVFDVPCEICDHPLSKHLLGDDGDLPCFHQDLNTGNCQCYSYSSPEVLVWTPETKQAMNNMGKILGFAPIFPDVVPQK